MSHKIYYFNPGHEAAILNESPYYMSPANVATMRKDLAYLPAWLADEEDYVLTENCTDNEFSNECSNFFRLPYAITLEQFNAIPPSTKLHLWGISPQSIHLFKEANDQIDNKLIIPRWDNKLKHLSSRYFARETLLNLISKIPDLKDNIAAIFFSNVDSIEDYVSKCNYHLLAKAPFSSSGRGLLWLPFQNITRTERQILHGIIKKQGSVSIEKVLNKKLDFAIEFIISADGKVNFEGYSLFKTNEKGAYIGNLLGSQLDFESIIFSYIKRSLILDVQKILLDIFESQFGGIYEGCIGVDMMIYENEGDVFLHPCVEINVRDNMGLIAITFYDRYINASSEGIFYIDYCGTDGELMEKNRKMKERYPLVFSKGKIKSGYLSLCPISANTKYRAYVLINSQ